MTTTTTDPAISSAVPVDGQLVNVRGRLWVASDIVKSSVTGKPGSLTSRPTHVVTLVSIDEDADNEQIRVVWELERGAVAFDGHDLPDPNDGLDDPKRLDAFLDAVRWGAIASADKTVLQAPYRSGIKLEDYQLDPVVRALEMPRVNLLIADDVGLGKTIEAGLVMQELMLRHRARTMLIVCPAGLTLQWRDEMRDKFGMEFRIVDAEMLRELYRSRGLYANPWNHYPRLIVSIDWLKRDRPLRKLREILPPVPKYPRTFDLLVVDEVHTCAPQIRSGGKYAIDSQRTTAIRTLAPHCENRLFLSATPHNGFTESWTALLDMLDDRRFIRGSTPDPEQLEKIRIRRMKRDLPETWDRRFAARKTDAIEVEYSEEEREAHRKLTEYAASRAESAAKTAGETTSKTADAFVITLLKKRLFSSPKAFAKTVETHLQTMKSRTDEAIDTTSAKILRPLIDRLDETAEDDSAFDARQEEALTAARRFSAPLTNHEKKLLEDLAIQARVTQDRADPKFDELKKWLKQYVGDADERVIIFTEYRDTQRWLYERLIAARYPKEQIAMLYGGQDREEREHVKTVFQEDPDLDKTRILLATDAASEGINLQNHCHRVLHWEIPWNPNRLEQRNGRVDRHGQHAKEVNIYHFVPKGWDKAGEYSDDLLDDELRFLFVAAAKTEQIREDLGSAGEVIASEIEKKMLGKSTDWVAVDSKIRDRAEGGHKDLKSALDLNQRLEELQQILDDSRGDLKLDAVAVEHVVRTALVLGHNKDLIDIASPENFPERIKCYKLPQLPGAWAEARNDGLYNPLTKKERPVTFDRDAAVDRSDVVLLHLGHRLVQMCLRLLRAELWAAARNAEQRLHRVSARVVNDPALKDLVVVGHLRVVVTGAEGTRLHEEVVPAGGRVLSDGRLKIATKDELAAWLDASDPEMPANRSHLERIAELWPDLSTKLTGILSRRSGDRRRSVESTIRDRRDEEIKGMNEILDQLERSIKESLYDKRSWEQRTIFDEEESEQFLKDKDALAERLEAIPAMREQETAALERRYAEPVSRWFPAAVTILIPRHLAMGAH